MSESVKQADLPQATHRTQAKQLDVTGLSAPTNTKQDQNSLERSGIYQQRPITFGSLTSIGSEGFSWTTPGRELGKAGGGDESN